MGEFNGSPESDGWSAGNDSLQREEIIIVLSLISPCLNIQARNEFSTFSAQCIKAHALAHGSAYTELPCPVWDKTVFISTTKHGAYCCACVRFYGYPSLVLYEL